jgi:hypothetical protein
VLVAIYLVLALAACDSVESRHRIIIYDHSWSSAAGVNNLWCVPELRASCDRQALQAESELKDKLSRAFRVAPECANVDFVIASQDEAEFKKLEDESATSAGPLYWRLRVDMHPGLTAQPFNLGPGLRRPLVGGDDAEHSASYICEAAKKNGITYNW